MGSVRTVRPRPLPVDERIPVFWPGREPSEQLKAIDGGALYRHLVVANGGDDDARPKKRHKAEKYRAPREVDPTKIPVQSRKRAAAPAAVAGAAPSAIHVPQVRPVADYDLNRRAQAVVGAFLRGDVDVATAAYVRHQGPLPGVYNERVAPEYDLDEEDETFLAKINQKLREDGLRLSPRDFERLMVRLEEGHFAAVKEWWGGAQDGASSSPHAVPKIPAMKTLLPRGRALEVMAATCPQQEHKLLAQVLDHWLRRRGTGGGGPLLARLWFEQPWKAVAFAHLADEEDSDADDHLPFTGTEVRSHCMQRALPRRRLNDKDAVEALHVMRSELEVVRTLADQVRRREKLKRLLLLSWQQEWALCLELGVAPRPLALDGGGGATGGRRKPPRVSKTSKAAAAAAAAALAGHAVAGRRRGRQSAQQQQQQQQQGAEPAARHQAGASSDESADTAQVQPGKRGRPAWPVEAAAPPRLSGGADGRQRRPTVRFVEAGAVLPKGRRYMSLNGQDVKYSVHYPSDSGDERRQQPQQAHQQQRQEDDTSDDEDAYATAESASDDDNGDAAYEVSDAELEAADEDGDMEESSGLSGGDTISGGGAVEGGGSDSDSDTTEWEQSASAVRRPQAHGRRGGAAAAIEAAQRRQRKGQGGRGRTVPAKAPSRAAVPAPRRGAQAAPAMPERQQQQEPQQRPRQQPRQRRPAAVTMPPSPPSSDDFAANVPRRPRTPLARRAQPAKGRARGGAGRRPAATAALHALQEQQQEEEDWRRHNEQQGAPRQQQQQATKAARATGRVRKPSAVLAAVLAETARPVPVSAAAAPAAARLHKQGGDASRRAAAPKAGVRSKLGVQGGGVRKVARRRMPLAEVIAKSLEVVAGPADGVQKQQRRPAAAAAVAGAGSAAARKAAAALARKARDAGRVRGPRTISKRELTMLGLLP